MSDIYKSIADFSEASAFEDTDKLLVSKSGVTKTVQGSKIKSYAQTAAEAEATAVITPYVTAAQAAQAAAESANTNAQTARTDAQTAKTAAETANTNAQTAKADAQTAQSAAENASTNAQNAAQTATQAATAMQECAAYSSTKAYAVGNMATYNGSTYRCTVACTGVVPTNTANWLLIAAKGTDGQGAGDMLASVYDPAGGAKQVAFYDHTHTAAQVGADVSGAAATVQTNLDTHTANKSNPHSVTASQVGLGAVENKALSTVLNRTTNVNVEDANYTTLMARGEALVSTDTTPTVNGAICWTYS